MLVMNPMLTGPRKIVQTIVDIAIKELGPAQVLEQEALEQEALEQEQVVPVLAVLEREQEVPEQGQAPEWGELELLHRHLALDSQDLVAAVYTRENITLKEIGGMTDVTITVLVRTDKQGSTDAETGAQHMAACLPAVL